MDGQPLTYDVTGAALELHVGKTKLREEIVAGRIRSFRVGKRLLISRDALEEYVAALEGGSVLVGNAPAR